MKTKKEELEAELTRLNALRKQVKEKLNALPLLEVGKWYISVINNIIYYGGEDEMYGLFRSAGRWINKVEYVFDNFQGFVDAFNKKLWREATPQEVEKALIEEAKKRGIVLGATVKDHYNNTFKNINGTYVYRDNRLAYGGCFIFQDGQWATIIEQDKFAELKEAHRNGAVIQFYNNFLKIWSDVCQNKPTWDKQEQYRIKPEEKPKVGDWIKYETGGGTKIAKLTEKNLSSFDKTKFKYTIVKDCYMIDKLNNL